MGHACFSNYLSFESESRLLDAFAKANILSLVYRALAGQRLLTACDQSRFIDKFSRQGRPGVPLKELLVAFGRINGA